MKLLILIFVIAIWGCGKDPLSNNNNPSSANPIALNSCQCNSDFSPVCGADKKDYENICLAQCFGNKSVTSGHCQCSNTLEVCGSDGATYSECDALSKNISIVKFIPCGTLAH